MRRNRIVRAAGAVVTAAVLSCAACWAQNTPARRPAPSPTGDLQGQSAPNFELKTLDGRTISLSDLRGKVVLLNFWATWCTPCRSEMPWLARVARRYRLEGLEIVGIAMNEPDQAGEVSKFARRMKVRYPIVLGMESVEDAYGGVRSLPQTFLIDRDGRIVKSMTGMQTRKELEDGIQSLLRADAQRRGSR